MGARWNPRPRAPGLVRAVGVAGVLVVVASTSVPPATARPSASRRRAAPSTASPCGNASPETPAIYDHVIWVWMENKNATDVLGSADAPYTNLLARRCGTASHYADVGSPSLPNYIGATSGDTQGIQDDDPPSNHQLNADNVFRQVRTAGKTERSYEESMRIECQLDGAGEYDPKHNPAAYYHAPSDRAACRHDDVPLGDAKTGSLRRDLNTANLPTFAFITPNLCDDTHDCSVRTGDRWLGQWLPSILASATYRAGSTAVFVVWDEPTPMPLIVISPTTKPGTTARRRLSHYALLRTTEELLGLPLLGHAEAATGMRGAFGL